MDCAPVNDSGPGADRRLWPLGCAAMRRGQAWARLTRTSGSPSCRGHAAPRRLEALAS